MKQIEYDLKKIAEAFDQNISYCGAEAYGAAGLWAVIGPPLGEEGTSDLVSMAALSAEMLQEDFVHLLGAFFWDYVKQENLDLDGILRLVGDILEMALVEQSAASVADYRENSGVGRLEDQQAIQKQLENFSETAFEYKNALKRRCGDGVRAMAAVAWNGSAGEIGVSAFSSPNMSPAEWANAFRAFLLLPLMDGTLTEDDVEQILTNTYEMLLSDKKALQSDKQDGAGQS
ncbi:MAG: hypothetical protein HDQ87_11910 [Clostridia bacterium]|nr:hypothetical protein [Clostridia bacterium]